MLTQTGSYWSVTLLFSTAMLMDGIAGILWVKDGQDVMKILGYPLYIMTITGVAKILGVVALVQTRFVTVREWAYAGFTINFLGASWLLAGKGLDFVIAPLVALAVMGVSYFLWKKQSR